MTKITEQEFHNNIQKFYNKLSEKTQESLGVVPSVHRLNVNNNTPRIEFIFTVGGIFQCFLWWNKNTGECGWSRNPPQDVV